MISKKFIVRTITYFCFFIILLSVIFNPWNKVYGSEAKKNVLFISSYNESFLSVPDQIAGVKSVLEPANVHVDLEYMDTKRFVTEESDKLFYELIKYKIHNLPKYDAVIAGDDYALNFVMDHQEELFKDIPIAFLGVNNLETAELAEKDPYITGIIEEMSVKENIELGIRINENASKIVAIVDDTQTGVGDKNQFYALEEEFPELSFRDINVSAYTFDQVGKMVEEIKDDTILMYFSMYTDVTGENLTIPEAINILKQHAKVPIIRAEVGGIGMGILGGKMVSYLESGKIAANMILDVFHGTAIESIPIVRTSPNHYIFDYNIMKQYNIHKKDLPKDSEIVGKKPNFFEQHPHLVINSLVILTALLIIVVILLIDNIKRRMIEKQLQESHEELAQTFEELTASEEELRAQYDTIQEHSQEIEILNQKYGIAIESTESAVWEYDIANNSFHVSNNFIKAINSSIKETEDINKIFRLLFKDNGQEKLISEFYKYKNGITDKINVQIQIYDQNDNKRWVIVRGRGVKDSKGELNIVHGILIEVTKLKEQEEYIEFLARHDYLTNLPNRLSFMNRLSADIAKDRPGAILLLDIDNFKSINDTLGHMFGDKMLQDIACRLLSLTDDKCFVSRFGGDEFLILIDGNKETGHVEKYIEELKAIFHDPFILKGKEYYIQFSIGITYYPEDSLNIDQLLINVDTAMYHVKKSGKNSYMCYSEDMLDELKGKSEIEQILRNALKDDGFALAYQPQVNVETGEIEEFEALIRLKKHRISPATFINVAEETGLIIEIGRWVTREVIRQIVCWREKGYELKPVAINFSSKQLKDTEYFNFLTNTITEYGIDSRYLEIEITESILMEQTEETMSFLTRIKELGIRIALDDFGTGYSSLNYLTFIPVDKIKLDKSLCEKFLKLDNIKVMNSLIALAHSLQLVITAEGIEEVEQFKRLKSGGCDYIQGYLFSRPLFESELDTIYGCNLLEKINIV